MGVRADAAGERRRGDDVQRPPSPTDAAAPKLGQLVGGSSLVEVAPAKLADTKIRVMNASGQGGQAGGWPGPCETWASRRPAANDPIYAGTRLTCRGQIPFRSGGPGGAASAWLVAPCVELYQDDRKDDSVDLVIGTDFTSLSNSDDIAAVLSGLRPGATEPADQALIARSTAPAADHCRGRSLPILQRAEPPQQSSVAVS